jgi:hypothetical protein
MAQTPGKKETLPPRRIMFAVAMTEPIVTMQKTPLKIRAAWPGGAEIARNTQRRRHKINGPHKSQSRKACSD